MHCGQVFPTAKSHALHLQRHAALTRALLVCGSVLQSIAGQEDSDGGVQGPHRQDAGQP